MPNIKFTQAVLNFHGLFDERVKNYPVPLVLKFLVSELFDRLIVQDRLILVKLLVLVSTHLVLNQFYPLFGDVICQHGVEATSHKHVH